MEVASHRWGIAFLAAVASASVVVVASAFVAVVAFVVVAVAAAASAVASDSSLSAPTLPVISTETYSRNPSNSGEV